MRIKIPFSKGHGTGNDFVLIFDPHDEIVLSPPQVANICERSFGIGADGLIRIVKTDGIWFMDYRNADGSLAEICGNGTRVMSRYLYDRKLVDGSTFTIATRAGDVKVIRISSDIFSVELGPIIDLDKDVQVQVGSNNYSGSILTAPNPHVVSIVDSLDEIGDLLLAPTHTPVPELPMGANFEFVHVLSKTEASIRIFERGVGETLSCGSGACAVAMYLNKHLGLENPITIFVPGGRLEVEVLPNGHALLTGPAKIVAHGEIDLEALEL